MENRNSKGQFIKGGSKINHPRWKGGKPKCIKCGKVLANYNGVLCQKHKIIPTSFFEKMKGRKPWNTGIKGKQSYQNIEGLKFGHGWNKGKKLSPLSEEHRKKIGRSGEKNATWKGGLPSCIDCGKKLATYKAKRCQLCNNRFLYLGEKNKNWKGGITPINHKIRKSVDYKIWRKAVFERDKYTCVWCGQIGGKLNADHIKPFSLFPELRLAIDNGRTLCISCHRKTDTWGEKAKHYQ